MDIALKVQSNDFSLANIREVVDYALRNQLRHAQLRRDHFAEMCRSFEQQHEISSDEFLRRFDEGTLGDDAYLFDWYAAKRGLDLWQQRFLILNGVSL
ncbi:MAG: hypothetical protein KF753_15550 [Caldilineaceae bacterium]|nr:hypothetical protein [Caldilineaceae bacterium]